MIKQLILSFFILSFTVFSNHVFAQPKNNDANKTYLSFMDGDAKVLEGLVSRSDIEKDSSFKWFQQNYNLGQADANAVKVFQQNGSKFQMIIFLGTWCEDTHNLLPVFFRLVDKSNYPADNITLIGVKPDKTTLDNLHKAFNIIDVPTFIVMKDGKEIGRVVEYGESGQIDKELGKIVEGL